MREHFGVGVGLEHNAFTLKPQLESGGIFDNAVMNDGESLSGIRMRMRICVTGFAVSGPPRVCDAGMAPNIFRREQRKISHLSLALNDAELLVVRHRYPCRVVSSVFEAVQTFDKDR
jgi:hypothetical protein